MFMIRICGSDCRVLILTLICRFDFDVKNDTVLAAYIDLRICLAWQQHKNWFCTTFPLPKTINLAQEGDRSFTLRPYKPLSNYTPRCGCSNVPRPYHITFEVHTNRCVHEAASNCASTPVHISCWKCTQL